MGDKGGWGWLRTGTTRIMATHKELFCQAMGVQLCNQCVQDMFKGD